MKKIIYTIFICFCLVCAIVKTAEDEFAENIENKEEENTLTQTLLHKNLISDPFYIVNKPLFTFNDFIFTGIQASFASSTNEKSSFNYKENLFFIINPIYNLAEPIYFFNNIFLFRGQDAKNNLLRFTINSTLGVLGIFDVAKSWFNIPKQEIQSGLTIMYYTNMEGPYIFIPVIGPNNTSDFIGFFADLVLDPISYFSPITSVSLSLFRRMFSYLNSKTQIDTLISISTDKYHGTQSLYYEKRRSLVDKLQND